MDVRIQPEAAHDNRRMFRKLAVFAVVMFGFGFALVPLYEKICEVTGINNLLRPDHLPANTQVDRSRLVTVEFDSNLGGNMPWTFRPEATSIRLHPGELTTIVYEVRNDSGRTMTGQAIPSYAPALAGQHFRKLQCFCFDKQQLAAGETRQMPIAFVVDPGIPGEVNTITLSFTFFEVPGRDTPASAAGTAPEQRNATRG